MNQNKMLFIYILIFAVVIGGAYLLYNQLGMTAPDPLTIQDPTSPTGPDGTQDGTSEEATDAQRTLAPDFTVYDLEGNAVKLSDYFGKPIVLNFWASWCGPCRMEMPDFNEKHRELGEKVTFLMVNMTDGSRETVKEASAFVTEQGYGFPVFFDTQLAAATAYGVYSLPTTYFIDADGYVIAHAKGAIDADTLQRGIDLID